MRHFAIIDVGKAGYRIVPLSTDGNAYIAHCRGMLTYSKHNLAKSAAKRMEESLLRRLEKK
ncbi:hypothetical protein [Sporomusa aerivorans]|uniref:hypothetical protein n=1 Tax=Sporomusa aerivorans TaxID=204936 RepID=UPI00352A15DF